VQLRSALRNLGGSGTGCRAHLDLGTARRTLPVRRDALSCYAPPMVQLTSSFAGDIAQRAHRVAYVVVLRLCAMPSRCCNPVQRRMLTAPVSAIHRRTRGMDRRVRSARSQGGRDG
jgi:hypothetical protein